MKMKIIGVDTGGTFTDFVFSDGQKISTLKLPSTPKNPGSAILKGIEPHLEESFTLIHGTTVATNAFLQKKMGKSAFICTKGFEHLLHIGRQNRTNLFSLNPGKPTPIIPLSLCIGVEERTFKDGTIGISPDKEKILEICHSLKQKKVESVGILFLHSYKNPENESFVADIMREFGFHVTASHEIMPEYREYERAVVTILNTTLKPVVTNYINNLNQSLKGSHLYIIQSNGGVLSPQRIIDEPIRTIISGPAGGVIAAKRIAKQKHSPNLITLDMGGTSTDVSLIKNGEATLTRDGYAENLPIRIPMIDIQTVGAGGGSIARIDRGGVLQVGPESAGADPGPSCYGKSDLPTVTDAFVVTGAICPELFLDGKMKIYPERSIKSVRGIADKLGKSLHQAAEGIILISVSSMERALRSVTLEKGEDPRFYTLMPFGGAGGMVATLLADRLGITRILIPPYQGVLSALGMLEADFQKEFTQSFLKLYSSEVVEELDAIFSTLTKEAFQVLREEGFSKEDSEIQKFLEIRYKGQSFELTIPFKKDFITHFHQEHQTLYSYSLNDEHCEIVNLRVLALGKIPKLKLEKKEKSSGYPDIFSTKRVFFNGEFQNFSFYRRNDFQPGNSLKSPCIIVSEDATIIVDKRFEASVDEFSNIILLRQQEWIQ
jgi:N-methylhydantoinase A